MPVLCLVSFFTEQTLNNKTWNWIREITLDNIHMCCHAWPARMDLPHSKSTTTKAAAYGFSIQLSNMLHPNTRGRLFRITCKRLKPLRIAGCLQLIQNSTPSVAGMRQCCIRIGKILPLWVSCLWLVAMQGVSIFVAILVTILLIIDGAVALYACLIWPRKEEAAAGRALFWFRSWKLLEYHMGSFNN